MNRHIFALVVAVAFSTIGITAEYTEYRPGGIEFASVWNRFYEGNHEPELDDHLIEAGENMTLAICEAIKNKDMRLRRYAIGALGFINDRRAIPALETILNSKNEIYYFRGDALHAIYQIDHELGKKYAREYGQEHKYLLRLQKAMERDESWLTRPTGH